MPGLIGQRLGQYEIISLLGEGGMAAVYRARQTLAGRVQREVAIKVIESKLARSPEFVTRFEREAQTIISFSHAHILKVFDYGQQDEIIYLVMELLSGGNLADRIRKGALSLDTASRLLDQIADALDYAHSKGVVHRDLKPQNVLLDESGNAFLSDFGIVKLLNETTGLTQSGAAVGTPAYMAPEQWQSGGIDLRADIYSLGVMLFEMVSGHVPFQGDTPFRMMHMHIYERPPSASSIRANVPPGVDRVLDRALAKDPSARYQSAGALAADFRAALNAKPVEDQTAVLPVMPSVPSAAPVQVTPPASFTLPTPPAPSGSSPAPIRGNRRVIFGVAGLIGVVTLIAIIIVALNNLGKNGSASLPTATVLIALLPTTPAVPTPADTQSALSASVPVLPSATLTAIPPTALALTAMPTTAIPPTQKLAAAPTNTNMPLTAVPPTTVPPTIVPPIATALPTNTAALAPTKTFTAVPPTNTATPAPVTATALPTNTPTLPPTATPLATPTATRSPGDARTDSKGIPQVYVPAGCFMMGSEGHDDDEVPVHQVCITQGFWLDRYEVSNSSFDAYLKATGDKYGGTTPAGFGGATQPRINVSWFEADAYARWRGCRQASACRFLFVRVRVAP